MKDFEKLKEHIKKHVKLGVQLRNDGRITYDLDEEQIHCPFHGVDNKKSARYYRETDTIYCWVCKKVWDILSFTSEKRGSNLREAINYLVDFNRLDISAVPEQVDALIQGITGPQKVELDHKKIFLMQLHDYIISLREKIELEKYNRLVFSYMTLKYSVTDDKFMGVCNSFNEALLRITKEIKNGK